MPEVGRVHKAVEQPSAHLQVDGLAEAGLPPGEQGQGQGFAEYGSAQACQQDNQQKARVFGHRAQGRPQSHQPVHNAGLGNGLRRGQHHAQQGHGGGKHKFGQSHDGGKAHDPPEAPLQIPAQAGVDGAKYFADLRIQHAAPAPLRAQKSPYAARRPSSSPTRGRQPMAKSLPQSRSLRGVPSGLEGSVTMLP